jgi:acyl-CoA synthetase (NDP forming)
VRYRHWKDAPTGTVRHFDADVERARGIIAAKAKEGGGYLSPSDVCRVLKSYHFPVCEQRVVAPDDDMVAAAKEVGYPLVVKVTGENIVHKSDVGGVVVGVGSDAALEDARKRIDNNLAAAGLSGDVAGYMLQEMAKPGKEVILGVVHDPTFGPLLMAGMGGKYVEILRDVCFRVMPVTDVDAAEMIRSIKAYPLLEGVRGETRVDIDFVVESIQRLAQLVSEVDGIAELDMNPVVVTPDRADCRIVDARIRISGEV